MTRAFDAIVIGAGQAGPALAVRLAGAGMNVALSERQLVGGTCVNAGCTPTKALVASAYAAHLARRANEFGVTLGGGRVGVDFKQIQARQQAIARRSRDNLESWLNRTDRCTLLRGHARLESSDRVRVNDDVLTAKRIFLNVGARACVPALAGLDQIDYLTSARILRLASLPRHLIVIGGSYVGLEFAQVFRRLGSEVSVVEMAARLISREDPDISAALRNALELEGVQVRTEAECIRFEKRGGDICTHVECASGEPEVHGSHVLLAVGR